MSDVSSMITVSQPNGHYSSSDTSRGDTSKDDMDASASLPSSSSQPKSSILGLSDNDMKISDMVSMLRRKGIEQYIQTPQIIVCGYQSSGKSSVLEAISEIPFPIDEGTCTKCIIEIVTSKSVNESPEVKVSFQASPNSKTTSALVDFKRQYSGEDEWRVKLADYLREAREIVKETTTRKQEITDHRLIVEVSGPSMRDLRLIDLPGLFGSDIGDGIKERAENIVNKYMKMSESIILAVVQCAGDADGSAAQSSVFDMCRKAEGTNRSIVVVTRPDTSNDELVVDSWIRNVRGKTDSRGKDDSSPPFQGLWHVVRNPSAKERKTITEYQGRNALEADFFRKSPWNQVPQDKRGAPSLQKRLEVLLLTEQKKQLPALHEQLCKLLEERESALSRLATGLSPDSDRIALFRDSLYRLRDKAKDDSGGHYGQSQTDNDTIGPTFVRARIRDEEELFGTNMIKHGHTFRSRIVPEIFEISSASLHLSSKEVPPEWEWARAEDPFTNDTGEIEHYSKILDNLRGSEGKWFASPERIDFFFWKLSKNWKTVAEYHVQRVYKSCLAYFEAIAPDYFDQPSEIGRTSRVAQKLINSYIDVKLRKQLEAARDQLGNLDDDRKMPFVDVDPSYLQAQQNASRILNFSQYNKGKRALDKQPERKGEAFQRQDPLILAQASGTYGIEEKQKEMAFKFVYSANSHYESSRRLWTANVVTQVMERYFVKCFCDLIPKQSELTPDAILDLLGDKAEQQRRRDEFAKVEKERDQLADYLGIVTLQIGLV